MLGSAIGAVAQLTTITASNLNRGGIPIPAATACFTATGVPGAGYLVGSFGQSSGQPVCRDVVNGVIMTTLKGVEVGSLQLADVTLSSPQNVCYNFTLRDSAGAYLIGTPGGQYSGYGCVQPSGATFDFDSYTPNVAAIPLGQSLEFLTIDHLTVSGDCTGPGCGSGGDGAALKTNGTNNLSQSVLNLQNGIGTTVNNPSGGNVQVNTTYGASANTAAQGNDSRIVGAEQHSALAPVAESGAYSDLSGKPTLPAGAIVGTTDTQTLTNKTVDGVAPATFPFLDPTSSVQTQLNAKEAHSALATVAESGAYNDLSGKPTFVSSFNSRTGAVAPASGDYTAGMVTNAAATNAANSFTAKQSFQGGLDGGFLPATPTAQATDFWFPRTADLGATIFQDYQDEFAFIDQGGATITASPAANSGTLVNVLRDGSTSDPVWTGSPFPIQITLDASTNPVTNKNNATGSLGLTFRSSGTPVPTNIQIELWDNTNAVWTSVYNQAVTVPAGFAVWLSPRFSFLSGSSFNLSKLRLTISGTNPINFGSFSLQRMMLYHATAPWDPWHLYVGGGSLYGPLALGGKLTFSTDNAYDIGASGATRPRNVYIAGQYNGSGAGLTGVPYAGLTGAPALATVATSGSYNDLNNKPSLPGAPPTLSVAGYPSSFTTNPGSTAATVANSVTGILFHEASQTTDNLNMVCKSAPATPYTITAKIAVTTDYGDSGDSGAGLAWRDSVSGKIASLWAALSAADTHVPTVFGIDFSDPVTYGGSSEGRVTTYAPNIWAQIADDGTNVHYRFSVAEGTVIPASAAFIEAASVPKASGYLGATGYNQVCLFISAHGADASAVVGSYGETSP
jgi:hypothetical protein